MSSKVLLKICASQAILTRLTTFKFVLKYILTKYLVFCLYILTEVREGGRKLGSSKPSSGNTAKLIFFVKEALSVFIKAV